MSERPRILTIDDEQQIRRLLQLTLEGSGYTVLQAATGEEGVIRVRTDKPDLVILDLGLPDLDGIEVLRQIRLNASVPVIILSVRSGESDIIDALDHGADDYLSKPFRTGELVARVRACLRKNLPAADEILTLGLLTIDLAGSTISKDGKPIKLTATELALLTLFVRNAGRVLTHKYILESVWGPAYAEETQYTRVHVGHLRRKIEADPANPTLIVTESGIGYRFVKS
jgi:two-component system KDP operon response regulator KdpE